MLPEESRTEMNGLLLLLLDHSYRSSHLASPHPLLGLSCLLFLPSPPSPSLPPSTTRARPRGRSPPGPRQPRVAARAREGACDGRMAQELFAVGRGRGVAISQKRKMSKAVPGGRRSFGGREAVGTEPRIVAPPHPIPQHTHTHTYSTGQGNAPHPRAPAPGPAPCSASLAPRGPASQSPSFLGTSGRRGPSGRSLSRTCGSEHAPPTHPAPLQARPAHPARPGSGSPCPP